MRVVSRIYNSFHRPDDRYFRAPNLHLATVLFSRDFALIDLDRTDSRHCQCVFRNPYDLDEMVERFNSRSLFL